MMTDDGGAKMAGSGRPAPGVRTGRPLLSRRAILRGSGALLALPWLAAMAPRARAGLGLDAAVSGPERLLYVYMPNGLQDEWWRPAELGPLRSWPETLAPLEPLARRITVVSGLDHHHGYGNGDGPGDHARASAVFLTGVQPLKADGRIGLGPSADQLIADAIGDLTPLRSLQVGVEGARLSGQCDSGYSCAYQGHVSWRDATTPAHKETSPRRLFDLLFRSGDEVLSSERRARRRSVLDFVAADAKRLERRLGGADRDRLDAYLTGLRELERRIDDDSKLAEAVPDALRPGDVPSDSGEHLDQLYGLLALAFEHDATRVATFMLSNEGTNRAYPELGSNEGHHGLSHHRGDRQKQLALQRIERFQVERFAAFLALLESVSDGAHDLLARTTVVFGSGISDGDRHQHRDLPIVVAGDMRGILRPGQHVRFAPGTPMNDLHLALMHRMGLRAERFGDARGRVASA